jgi:hypothetical protein
VEKLNRQERRRAGKLANNSKEFSEFVVQNRLQVLQASLLASLDTLKEDFNFDEKQLNDFAVKHNERLKATLGGGK